MCPPLSIFMAALSISCTTYDTWRVAGPGGYMHICVGMYAWYYFSPALRNWISSFFLFGSSLLPCAILEYHLQ